MGWAFAIAGDMIYFAVLMAATLWLSGMFGDERVTVGVVLLSVWGLSLLIRRRQQRSMPRPAPVAVRTVTVAAEADYTRAAPSVRRVPRKKAGRGRRTR